MNTVGQKRPSFATVGVKVDIEVNAFPVEIASQTVHQYDGKLDSRIQVSLVDPFHVYQLCSSHRPPPESSMGVSSEKRRMITQTSSPPRQAMTGEASWYRPRSSTSKAERLQAQ
jgi:hypothetical protein